MADSALNREIRELNNDRMIQRKVLEAQKNQFAEMLRGELGVDIKETLEGKRVVKLSLKEKIKYKINNFFDKLFNIL